MSFGGSGNSPQPKQKPFGIEPHRISTSEQARPVAMLCGRQRLGVTFISRAFNLKTNKVTKSTGKKDSVVGYDYFASLAAAICLGPVDELTAIYLNSELEWSGLLQRGVAHPLYADGTLAGLKNSPFRIYWGTENQVADLHLNDTSLSKPSGATHPAYRGVCYLVFNQLFFGFNQTNVQNIEVVVGRYPTRTWIADARVGDDANPIAFIADVLQHHRGGSAVPDEQLDTADLNAVAVQLENENVGMSPWLDRAQESKQHLLSACEYFDGYPKIGSNGKFSIGLIRAPEDLDALITVSETHFTRRPQFSPEDWTAAASETRTVFTNADTEHKEDVTPAWRDTGLREIIGEPHALVLQRPWFTRPAMAESYNKSLGPANALPKRTGKLYLRRTGTLFETLIPGALFKLDYASRNISGLVLRVTDRLLPNPARPEFEISVAVDRGYIYQTPPFPAASAGDDPPAAPVAQPLFLRIVELPLALCPEGKLSLAMLHAREDLTSLGYAIYLKKDYAFDGAPAESYEQIATSTSFAKAGTVIEDFAVGASIEEIGILIRIDGADISFDEQTPWDAVSDDLLIFVGEEVLSVHRIEVVSAGVYRFFTVRGRFATTLEAHASGSQAFVIERRNIEPQQHALFQPFNSATFKVVSVGDDAPDVSDIDPVEVEITGRIYKQTPVTNLRVNDSLTTPSYSTGDDVAIAWTLTDARRDLNQRRLLRISTILEFLVADVVVHTEEVEDELDSLLISNADLIVALGGEVSFTLRAKTRIDADFFQIHSDPVELEVQFV